MPLELEFRGAKSSNQPKTPPDNLSTPMPFWDTDHLRERLRSEKLISKFQERRLKCGAYELTLGREAFLTSNKDKTKVEIPRDTQISIPPGQFGLLITEETVTVPKNAIAFISIKASIKFKGLINISGFHVDPGFSGKLKFSVFNAATQNIPLARGEPVFLIWFADMTGPVSDPYEGKHKYQSSITSDDVSRIQGNVPSPAALNSKLEKFIRAVTLVVSIGGSVLTIIAGVAMKGCYDANQKLNPPPPSKESNALEKK